MYQLTKITNYEDFSRRDINAINIAIKEAEKSDFPSFKLGSCLYLKGTTFLW